MSKFTFEVNEETFAVNAYIEGQVEPFIYQPEQPNGDVWESAEQATAWIESVIAELEAPAEPASDPAPVEAPPAE